MLAAKVGALVEGRFNASFDDIKRAAHNALRHRMLLNFEGEAEGVKVEKVLDEVLMDVKPDLAAAVPA
jgi:MoxR-like ATPase